MNSVIDSQKTVITKKKKFDIETLKLYSLCAIPLLLVFVFCYVPMFGIVIAFKDYRFSKGIFGSEWVGLKNFELFVTSNDFWKITKNTLLLNFTFIICGTVAAIALAILLFRLVSRTKTKIFQTVLITPNFISWVIVSYMVYALLNPEFGLINQLLGIFGKEAVDWYSKPEAWPFILTVTSIWKNVGMDSVVYYAALMAIDNTLYEAAEIDGASRWKQTVHITIPELVPLITILTILKIGGIFRADFGLFYQVTRNVGALYPTTDVVDTYIFRMMRVVGNMGLSSAAGLLQSLVGFVLVVLTNYMTGKIDPERTLF